MIHYCCQFDPSHPIQVYDIDDAIVDDEDVSYPPDMRKCSTYQHTACLFNNSAIHCPLKLNASCPDMIHYCCQFDPSHPIQVYDIDDSIVDDEDVSYPPDMRKCSTYNHTACL